MTTISISVKVANSGQAQLKVNLLGPNGYDSTYPVTKTNTTKLNLANGIYSIKVSGPSGNKVDLSVTDAAGKSLATGSNPGPNINMMTGFTVNAPVAATEVAGEENV